MRSFRDYKSGQLIEIDTKTVTLISANPAIDATLMRVEEDGKAKNYLVRDSVDEVMQAFQ